MVDERPAPAPESRPERGRRPVLAAVDFSDDARAALIWAANFADRARADLVILHVVHDPASQPGMYFEDRKNGHLQPMQAVAQDMLDGFVGSVREERPGLERLQSAELRLVPGLPPGRIVEFGQKLDARVIVLGSRGMTGLPHLLQGSVSERVVKLADRPVVVVKSRDCGG
jgi:nucleotide-binding universal stress UspA family protein